MTLCVSQHSQRSVIRISLKRRYKMILEFYSSGDALISQIPFTDDSEDDKDAVNQKLKNKIACWILFCTTIFHKLTDWLRSILKLGLGDMGTNMNIFSSSSISRHLEFKQNYKLKLSKRFSVQWSSFHCSLHFCWTQTWSTAGCTAGCSRGSAAALLLCPPVEDLMICTL